MNFILKNNRFYLTEESFLGSDNTFLLDSAGNFTPEKRFIKIIWQSVQSVDLTFSTRKPGQSNFVSFFNHLVADSRFIRLIIQFLKNFPPKSCQYIILLNHFGLWNNPLANNFFFIAKWILKVSFIYSNIIFDKQTANCKNLPSVIAEAEALGVDVQSLIMMFEKKFARKSRKESNRCSKM